jgi:hypothetical protein
MERDPMKHPAAARAFDADYESDFGGGDGAAARPTTRRSVRTTGRRAMTPDEDARDGDESEGASPGRVREADEVVATPAEVLLAVETLKPATLLRLKSFARYRVRVLGAHGHGLSDDALLQEAVVASLSGLRRWRPRAVDFEGHLGGVMRSLSSHWAERQRSMVAMSEATERTLTGATSDASEPATPFVEPAASPGPEAEVAARQELAAIQARFAEDDVVLTLIEALASGLKGPEIKEQLGWTQTELETAMRRLRRGVSRMERGEGKKP